MRLSYCNKSGSTGRVCLRAKTAGTVLQYATQIGCASGRGREGRTRYLEGSRFTRRQFYRYAAGGSREWSSVCSSVVRPETDPIRALDECITLGRSRETLVATR